MGNGSFFHGLVSGLNQGITDARKQNQKDAEDEIQSEQTILTHLATTHPDQNIRDQAVEALLNIHESGKPTGILGKLMGKRSKNPDLAALIASAHPANSGGGEGIQGQAPVMPQSMLQGQGDQPPALPSPDASAAPVAPPQPAPVFAPAPIPSDAPEDRGGPPNPVSGQPVDAPMPTAAQPINTTSRRAQIDLTGGQSSTAPAGVPPTPVSASSPAPFPPPPAAAMPPASSGLGGLSPADTVRLHASATIQGQLEGERNALIAAGRTPEEANRIIDAKMYGASGRTAAASNARIVEALGPLIDAGTATPEQKSQYSRAAQILKLDPTSRDYFLEGKKDSRQANKPDTRSIAIRADEALKNGDLEAYNRLLKVARDVGIVTQKPKDYTVSDAARSDRSYQYIAGRIDALRKPIADQAERFNRLADTVNSGSPQADALIAPELLTVMAGGAGSGLRMSEPEIARIIHGRSRLEDFKAMLSRLSIDPSAANSITLSQREQIRDLMGAVRNRLGSRIELINNADEALVNADSVTEHRMIASALRKKMDQLLTTDGGNVGNIDDGGDQPPAPSGTSPRTSKPTGKAKPPETVTYKGVVTKFADLPPEVQAKVMELRK